MSDRSMGNPDRCGLVSSSANLEGKTMSKQTRVFNPIYSFLPTEVEGFDSLAELALDMRGSWNHYADELWRQLDQAQKNAIPNATASKILIR